MTPPPAAATGKLMPSQQDKHFWSPEVRQLTPYVPGEQPAMDNLLKLNTNESPFPPAPGVASAIAAVLAQQASALRLYPDPEARELKQAIARQQNLPVEQVFVGNGSDEVLAHIFKAFFIQDQPILYPDISYSFYPVYAQYFNISARTIALTPDFCIDIASYNQPNGGIIFANPNAPTGICLPLEQIAQLLTQHPRRVVVVDEAYVDFGAQSACSLISQFPNLVVCQTTSKSRALAGLRIGMAFAQPHLIAALDTVKNSFNSYPLDRLAIAGGIASFADQAYFASTCQQIITNRQQLTEGLQALGFEVLPSRANFVFTRHAHWPAAQIAARLRQRGIIVRHFSQARIDNYLRITVGTAEQQARLLGALHTVLNP